MGSTIYAPGERPGCDTPAIGKDASPQHLARALLPSASLVLNFIANSTLSRSTPTRANFKYWATQLAGQSFATKCYKTDNGIYLAERNGNRPATNGILDRTP
eukprot:5735397-Amphidinium_carterae.1